MKVAADAINFKMEEINFLPFFSYQQHQWVISSDGGGSGDGDRSRKRELFPINLLKYTAAAAAWDKKKEIKIEQRKKSIEFQMKYKNKVENDERKDRKWEKKFSVK